MISILVAKSENGCIGVGGNIPWYIPSAYRFWKKVTKKKTLIIGRQAYEDLPRNYRRSRRFWILSRTKFYKSRGNVVFQNIEDLLELAHKNRSIKEYIVVGGMDTFRQFLPHSHKFYFVDIKGDYHGDAYFPLKEFEHLNTFVYEEKDFSTYTIRIHHRVMRTPYSLLTGNIPKSLTKKRLKKYQKHYNRTTRRKKDKLLRKQRNAIFEFELNPKLRRYVGRSLTTAWKNELDLLTYKRPKKNPVGRPKKAKLSYEERMSLINRLGLNKTIKQLKEELNG